MKNTIFLIVLLIAGLLSAQKYEINNGKFETTVRTGTGENVPITFTITDEVIRDIQMSDRYQSFLIDETFIKNNMEKRGMRDEMTVFLFSEVNAAVSSTTVKLKNKSSFSVSPKSVGAIRFENGGSVIVFPFSAKNDLGQDMIKTSVVRGNIATFIN